MPSYKIFEHKQIVSGVEITWKVKGPELAKIEPIHEKFKVIAAQVEHNPDQLGLGLEATGAEPPGEDDPG